MSGSNGDHPDLSLAREHARSHTRPREVIESDLPEEEKMEAYKKLAERSPYMRCLLPLSGFFFSRVASFTGGGKSERGLQSSLTP